MDALDNAGDSRGAKSRDRDSEYYPVLKWLLRLAAAFLIANIPTRLGMHDLVVGIPFTWESRLETVSLHERPHSFSLLLLLLDVCIWLLVISLLTKLRKVLPQRRFLLSRMLLVAIAVTGVSWWWKHQVSLPDPSVVIRTSEEAVEGARKFLALARVTTDGYDLGDVKEDRFKGARAWVVRWKPTSGSNDIVVSAVETGYFNTSRPYGVNQEEEIAGDLTAVFRNRPIVAQER